MRTLWTVVFAACADSHSHDDAAATGPSDIAADTTFSTDTADADSIDHDALSACPAEVPTPYSTCVAGLACNYGDYECCGRSVVSAICNCEGGRLSCLNPDTCLLPQCSPGCGWNELLTPEGCASCETGTTVLNAALDDAARTHDACVHDSDCVITKRTSGCGLRCDIAVAADAEDAFSAEADALESNWSCSDAAIFCYAFRGACVPNVARCIDGRCRSEPACDPARNAVGEECDDFEPCTSGDVCAGDFWCQGTPVDCDDGDPCTLDFCRPRHGCEHNPQSGCGH